MVKFPFTDNSGFEVPFPSHGRRTPRGSRRVRGDARKTSIPRTSEEGVGGDADEGNTRAFLPHLSRDHSEETSGNLMASSLSPMNERIPATATGSTRLSMLGGISWVWSSTKSAMMKGGSFRKSEITPAAGISSTRQIDLNYDDSDMDNIQSREQSIDDAAIQARRSYVARQEIHHLRLALYVMLALILGVAVAFTIVGVHKTQQPASASSIPTTTDSYTPPKPKDELNLWCDLSLLLSNNNSAADYQTCYQACVEGMCCFGGMFDTFPAMQDNEAHHNCYTQKDSEVCTLYKPCENLIVARDQFFFNSNYSAIPTPPNDLPYICSEQSVVESIDHQLQCQDLCSKAACCYPQHPSTCSTTDTIACSPYSICWNLDFVVAAIDEADALQIQNPSNRNRNETNRK